MRLSAKETLVVLRPDMVDQTNRNEELGDVIIDVNQSKNDTHFINSTEHIFMET